jgi:hypothetical protein
MVRVNDSTPPSVNAVGLGSRAAFSVPLEIFDAFVVSVVALAARPVMSEAAGCELETTPAVEIALIHRCEGAV